MSTDNFSGGKMNKVNTYLNKLTAKMRHVLIAYWQPRGLQIDPGNQLLYMSLLFTEEPPTFNIAIHQLNLNKSLWNTKHLLFTTYECPRGEAHMDN